MKKILLLLMIGLVIPSASNAQLGGQCDVPVNITVIQKGFPAWIREPPPYGVGLPSNVTVKYFLDNVSLGTIYETATENYPLRLKPGVKYVFKIDNFSGTHSNFVFRAPENYAVFIDNKKSYGKSTGGTFSTSTGYLEYTVEIRYANETGEDSNPTAPGFSPLVSIGDLRWEVGLGALKNGMSAGTLRLCDDKLDAATFTRTSLSYSAPLVNDTDELHAILEDLDSNGTAETIRQIKAPQCLVDVVETDFDGPDVIGYEVRFYNNGTYDSGTGLYIPTGSTLVTYHIRKTASGQMTISQTDSRGTRNSVINAISDGSLLDWDLSTSGLGAAQTVTINNTDLGGGQRQEFSTISQSGISGAPSEATGNFNITRIYEAFDADLGELLVSETDNESRTTTYHYYVDATKGHQYGQLKAVEKPFGDWAFYEYYDVTADPYYSSAWDLALQSANDGNTYLMGQYVLHHGKLKRMSSPSSGSFSFDPATYSATGAAGVYEKTYYWLPILFNQFNGGPAQYLPPVLFYTETEESGQVMDKSYFFIQRENLPTGSFLGGQAERFYYYVGAGGNFTSIGYDLIYPDSDPSSVYVEAIWRGRLHTFDDGTSVGDYLYNYKPVSSVQFNSNLQVSYGYVEVASYPGVGDAWVEIEVSGILASGGSLNDLTHSGEATVVFPDVRDIALVDGKSTKELAVYNSRGELSKTESWAYTDIGSWSLISRSTYTRNSFGQLLSISRTSGAGGSRIVYEAGWTGLQKDYEIDETGIRTDYTYDGLDRVLTSDRSGSGSADGIPGSIAVTTYHDALGRQVQEKVGSGGDQLTTTQQFDSRGRVLSTTDVNGLTTTTSYTNAGGGGLQATIAHPQGSEVRVTRPDGKLKSSTGTAVVDTYYSHTYDGTLNGALVTRTDIGSATSDIYRITHADFLGRIIHEESTTAQGTNFERDTVYYHALNKPEYTLETEVAKGSASGGTTLKTIFEYDDLYNLIRYGIDVNGNDSLDLAGTDRITENETTFIDSSGLHARTVTAIYSDSSATAAVLRTTLNQLAGLSSSEISNVISTDLFGNTTTTTAIVDRGASTVTVTADVPESDTDVVQIQINGFLSSSTNAQSQTAGFSYNSAGLPTEASHARGFDTVTEYYPNKLQIESITEGSGVGPGYETQYGYDTAGRLNQITDPNTKNTYLDYNSINQVTHQWGSNTAPVEYEYDSIGRVRYQRTYRDAATSWDTPTWPGGGTPDITEFTYHTGTYQVWKRIDAASEETVFSYDQRGRLMTRTSPRSSITTTYQYDPKTDELLDVGYTDSTPDLAYTWNRMGALATVIEDNGGANQTTRTFNYQLAYTAGSKDNLQLLSEDLPDYYPSGLNKVGYTYSTSGMAGRPLDTGIGTSTGLEAFKRTTTYQANGRMGGYTYTPTQASLAAKTWTYGYLADSNLIADIELTGSSLNHHRGYKPDRDLLSSIATRMGTSSDLVKHAYSYDPLSRREYAVRSGAIYDIYKQFTEDASGSTTGPPGVITDYGYNDRSHLTSARSYTGSSDADFTPENLLPGRDYGLTFDAQGNRTQSVINGQAAAWTPNQLNQIASRQNPGVVDVSGSVAEEASASVGTDLTNIVRAEKKGNYFHAQVDLDNSSGPVYRDGTTNPITVYGVVQGSSGDTIATDARSAFLNSATETFSYDEDGNLAGEDRWDYTWDAENRLTVAATTAAALAAGAPKQKVEFRYDYLGRRVQRTYSLDSGSGYQIQTVTLWAYDGFNPIYERVEDGAAILVTESFFGWGLDWSGSEQGAGGVGGLLLVVTQDAGQTAEAHYPGYDGNGNVAVLADESGTILGAYEYDPFGKLLRASGDKASSCKFRFSTKYHDAVTGLVDYGFRWYRPEHGRFINRDPIAENGGLNLYALVNNNPVNQVDVLGLQVVLSYDAFTGGNIDPLEGLQGGSGSSSGSAASSFTFNAGGFGGSPGGFSASLGGRDRPDFSGGNNGFNSADIQQLRARAASSRLNQQLPQFDFAAAIEQHYSANFDYQFIQDILPVIGDGRAAAYWEEQAQMAQVMNDPNGYTKAVILKWVNLAMPLSALAGTPLRIVGTGSRVTTRAELRLAGEFFDDVAEGSSLAARRGAGWFDDVARNATRNADSNKLVLGHFSREGTSYQKVAAHYKATYFKVNDWNAVTKGLSNDEIWNINRAFLTQQVKQGKQILFSHNPLKARPQSFFEREVNFLQDLGYSFRQKNQWTWEAFK